MIKKFAFLLLILLFSACSSEPSYEISDWSKQEALKQGGNNKDVDGKKVKLSGYIVPIDIDADNVSTFLFFPNQAACIHVPASPANQTIFVTAKKDGGVMMEDAYENIVVYGTIHLRHTEVANGTASFVINDATCKAVPRL